jgi:hydrogenase maturation protease
MILIIGYGNPLRGDDALGQVAAEHLARRFADDKSIHVQSVHQLTPELSEKLAVYDRVIFIDARHSKPAGELYVEEVQPASASDTHSFSHYVTPAELLLLANKLYDSAPYMLLTGISGDRFDVGQPLSAPVRQAVPQLCDAIEALVRDHG